MVISRTTARLGSDRVGALSSLPFAMSSRLPSALTRIVTSSFVAAISAESRTTRFLIVPRSGSIATTACGCARPTYTVPSTPSARPCGSPGSDQRRTILGSLDGTDRSVCARHGNVAADKVSSTVAAAVWLPLECVGEVFDDRVREELLAHLPNLLLDFRS